MKSLELAGNALAKSISTAADLVGKYLNARTREVILGRALAARWDGGRAIFSLHHLACCCDAMRVFVDVLPTNGTFEEDKQHPTYSFLERAAATFASALPDYELKTSQVAAFLERYRDSESSFGYRDFREKWYGIHVCRNVAILSGDSEPLTVLQRALMRAAVDLSSSDPSRKLQKTYLDTLKSELGIPITIESYDQITVPNERLLTVETANQFVKDPSSVDLGAFTLMEDGAADALARSLNNDLALNGLRTLSDTGASSLSHAKARGLRLNSLTSLSDFAFCSLCRFQGVWVELNGLTSLSDAAAKCLGENRGARLKLNGLTSLSDVAAANLAQSSMRTIELNGLTSLSDAAASELANCARYALNLNGLNNLSDTAARSLGKFGGTYLSLMGIKQISSGAALELASSTATVFLDGLESLPNSPGHVAIATKLAQHHEDDLQLNSLTLLAAETAEALSRTPVVLELDGLVQVSEAVVEKLVNASNGLSLSGLASLSEPVADRLAIIPGGFIRLNGIKSLPEEVLKRLAKVKACLILDGFTHITDTEAKILASHEGELCLNGLTSISDHAIESLLNHEDAVYLSGLTSMNALAAGLVSKCGPGLTLNRLAALSDEAAERLSHYTGDELELNGLKNLSEAAAECLSHYAGDSLQLNGLTELSDRAVCCLCKFKGTLHLEGLDSLSAVAAECLAGRSTYTILSQSAQDSINQLDALVSYEFDDGDVVICGMFVATIGELEMCQGKKYTIVNGHTSHDFEIDDLVRVNSKDQSLIAKLIETFGSRSILGNHVVENRFEFAEDYDLEVPEEDEF